MDQLKLNHQGITSYSNSLGIKLAEIFFADKDIITGKEILKFSSIPQINFFILKVLFVKWQEESEKIKSPYFNFSHDSVRKALNQFMNTLSQHIEIHKTDFLVLVTAAVQDALYLTFSPYEFFWAEFNQMDEESFSYQKLKSLQKYIKVNQHIYKELLEELAEKSDEVNKELAVAVLDKIFSSEDILVEDPAQFTNMVSELVELTESMIYHVATPEAGAEDDASFFDQQFEDEPEKNTELVSPPKISASNPETPLVAKSVEPVQRVPVQKKETFRPTTNKVEEPFIDKIGAETATGQKEEVSEEVESIFDQQQDEQVDILNKKFEKPKVTLNDQLKSENTTLAEKLEAVQLTELLKSLNINQRFMFQNELFRGSEADMVHAFSEIEGASDFDAAVDLLVNNFAKKHSWKMDSLEVKELLKIVFKKFRGVPNQ